MAAALVAPVSDAAEKTSVAVKNVWDQMKDDPVYWITTKMAQVGSVLAVAGGIMMAAAPTLNQMATNARNDMEDTLGLPRTLPPGTPLPPPNLSPILSLFQSITASVASLDNTSVVTATTQIQGIITNLNAFQNLADATTSFSYTVTACQDGSTLMIQNPNWYELRQRPIFACVPVGTPDQTERGLWTVDNAKKAGWVGWIAAPGTYTVQARTQTPPGNVDIDIVEIRTELAAAVAALTVNPDSTDWASAAKHFGNTVNSLNDIANAYGWPLPFQGAGTNGGVPVSSIIKLGTGGILTYISPGGPIVGTAEAIYAAAPTLYNDAAAVAGDIAKALQVIGSAIVNFPRILADGIFFLGDWTAGQIFQFLGPILLGIGLALAIAGYAVRWFWVNLWPKLKGRFELAGKARVAGFLNWFDSEFHTKQKVETVWAELRTEGAIAAANVEPVYVPSTSPLPSPPIDLPGRKARSQRIPKEVGSEEVEKPVPTPTSEVEKLLGEGDVKEPTAEELRAQEEARKASLPIVGQESDAAKAPPEPQATPGDVPVPPPSPPETPPVPAEGSSPPPPEEPPTSPDFEAAPAAEAQQTEAEGVGEAPAPEDSAPAAPATPEKPNREPTADELLAMARTSTEMYEIADEQTRVIRQAQATRRAAKAMAAKAGKRSGGRFAPTFGNQDKARYFTEGV